MADLVEAIFGTAWNLLFQTSTSIGGITPDVLVEEVGRDTTFVTNHPVEHGAMISDHAFMMPTELEMRVAWSDSSGGYRGYSSQVYQMLLALQGIREPFTVVTARRTYTNMLITQVETSRAVDTAFALPTRLSLREIIIAETQTTTAAASSQANPQQTSGVSNLGNRQLSLGQITAPSYLSPGNAP